MKFNININQLAIIKSGIDIDFVDAILIDFLIDFSKVDSIVKVRKNNLDFFWFSYEKINEELPLLNLKKDSIYRRMKKLCGVGLLIHFDESQMFGRSLFAITEKCYNLKFINAETDGVVFKSEPEEKKETKAKKRNVRMVVQKGSESNPDNNKTIDNNLLFPEGNIKGESVFKKASEVYFDFYKKMNDVSPKFDGADGKALKSIIEYFKKLHKEEVANGKTGKESGEFITDALIYIFDNWGLQVDFIRNQTKMTQINSNLNNIINKIRNAKSKSTSGNSDKGNSGVRKIAKFTAEEFGIPSENPSE